MIKIKFYWNITKEEVEVCKECELKYVCFDCREISLRAQGDLYAPNPYCLYIPEEGRWQSGKLKNETQDEENNK